VDSSQSTPSRAPAAQPLPFQFFTTTEPVEIRTDGKLPHWEQDGTIYFVTFRLSDSLPQEKLVAWAAERDAWLAGHPPPHDEATMRLYYDRFPKRMQGWLDAGYGSCLLRRLAARTIVEDAIRHFDRKRYYVDEYVVAANHVHVLIAPIMGNSLSAILHSWKSFTAHALLRLIEREEWNVRFSKNHIWQRESFDHIVRSESSLEKLRAYIRAHQK
jgi:putative transposase